MATPSKNKPVAIHHEEDDLDWDDGPSSPFVTELAVAADTGLGLPSTRDLTNLTLDLTPSRQLRMESEPFNICEDETSMSPHQQMDSTVLFSPSKTVEKVEEPHFADNTEVMEEEGDMTIDDTCFSAFSEVPNLDMTRFARIGQSPTKSSIVMDQVSSWTSS